MKDPVKELQKLGYTVKQFNGWHHRVDDAFDFWTSNKRSRWIHWHDLSVNERGEVPPGEIVSFIQNRLGDPGTATHVSKAEFIRRLVDIGWAPGEAEHAWKERQSSHTSSQA